MNNFRTLILIALVVATGWAQAAEFTGKVISVMDGDTLMVIQGCERVEPEAPGTQRRPPCGGKNPVKVRLAEVDAPEKAQPYGMESQQSLAKMVMGKQIRVVSRAIDDYGRMVALVHIDGLNVNHEQVRRGWAWEYSRFHNNRAVLALQNEARQAKRGLWAGTDFTEPSQWRKLHPSTIPIPATGLSPGIRNDASPTDPSCVKKHCSKMTSCDEARDYLNRCGRKMLDGDGDGMPCESLCAPQKKIKN